MVNHAPAATQREAGRLDSQMEKWARKIFEDGAGDGEFGNKLATALPMRPQRQYNVNEYSLAVNSFGSMVFPRQPSATPTPR